MCVQDSVVVVSTWMLGQADQIFKFQALAKWIFSIQYNILCLGNVVYYCILDYCMCRLTLIEMTV